MNKYRVEYKKIRMSRWNAIIIYLICVTILCAILGARRLNFEQRMIDCKSDLFQCQNDLNFADDYLKSVEE